MMAGRMALILLCSAIIAELSAAVSAQAQAPEAATLPQGFGEVRDDRLEVCLKETATCSSPASG